MKIHEHRTCGPRLFGRNNKRPKCSHCWREIELQDEPIKIEGEMFCNKICEARFNNKPEPEIVSDF